MDLTGGVVTIINLHSSPSNLLMAVKTAVKAGSMVACATPKGVSRWWVASLVPKKFFFSWECPSRVLKQGGDRDFKIVSEERK